MQCPSCNADAPEDSKFCGKCGTALPRCCSACGHAVPTDSNFCQECGAKLTSGSAKKAKPAAHRPADAIQPASTPERRQLTVMFCDMVGSSALSTRLDPEEQREVVSTFQDCCATEIKRFGGMVAQYLGDGVLAYFGYPAAHEDDAERGARAGLAILAAVGAIKLAPDETLQTRIGIASGIVVVGDLVRGGVTQENAAIGETTNLAARLESLAEPNTLLICPETHRLVGVLFEYRDLGPQALRGFAAPVHVLQVTGASKVENRFEARRGSASPLLGRDEELELLLRRWEQAKRGEGRVVLLTGEAGIGKSRLTRALQERLSGEPHTPLVYHCSPYHHDSPLYPVISQLLRSAGIEPADVTQTKVDKLEALLAQSTETLALDVALLAKLLSIQTGDRHPLPALTPQQLKDRTLRALLSQLERLASRQTLLMVFEDLHWIDPTSLDLLSLAVDRIKDQRVLLVATARPEFAPPWASHRHISSVNLGRLDRREGEDLVRGVTGDKSLPPEVLSQILARTDGVPLFIEELTKTVLESGLLREVGTYFELTAPLPPLAIPSTLHASLLARLDRLASVKDVAQIGAAIGREFSYALIASVAALPEKSLQDALGQLIAAELVFQRGLPPDARYEFKHALVRDAAYASLVRSRREAIHAAIAHALEEKFADVAKAQPEIVAHHFNQASIQAKAIDYWEQAGLAAIARSAHSEAISLLRAALQTLDSGPGSNDKKRELALVVGLASSLRAARGNGAPEVGEAYRRARNLAKSVGDGPHTLPTLYGLWNYGQVVCDYESCMSLGEQLLAFAEKGNDPLSFVAAHRALGTTLHRLGSPAPARTHIEQGLPYYDRHVHGTFSAAYGADLGVSCLHLIAWCLWELGHPDQAVQKMEETRALADDLAHPLTATWVCCWVAILYQFRQEPELVGRFSGEALVLAEEQRLPQLLSVGKVLHGWSQSLVGNAEAGIAELHAGIEGWRATGARHMLSHWLTLLAECYWRAGNIAAGLSQISNALNEVETTGQRSYAAEAHRIRGELLLSQIPPDEAEAERCFQVSIEAARRQEANGFLLRATVSLGRLWLRQGKGAEAHAMLRPVYDWFTEGFDTPDLKDAKMLLERLSA